MAEYLSRAEVRELDATCISGLSIPGVILMENAGRGATDVIENALGGSVAGKRIAIVASTGNNGGDGFVIARHLQLRDCAEAPCLVVGELDKLTPDAGVNLRACKDLGGMVEDVSSPKLMGELAWRLSEYDCIVDAVGGTGVRGALRGNMLAAARAINEARALAAAAGRAPVVVAIDIPTGLDCDTGVVAEGSVAVEADCTVTFLAAKLGFKNADAARFTGRVHVAHIGVKPAAVRQAAARLNKSS